MGTTLTRTVCVKLAVGDAARALTATQAAFNEAATWIAQVCWDEGITNTNTAHHRVYGETRFRFGLGSQLACCARAKAVEALTAGRISGSPACPTFGLRGSVRYDARTFRLMALDQVSLHTSSGRVVVRMLPGHRQHTMLVDPSWKIGGADLVWRDGMYYLHLTQTCRAPATNGSGGVLGVDLGQVELSTDSDGEHVSGGIQGTAILRAGGPARVKGMRHYYAKRRHALQRRGSKSARRRLKQVKRREARFQRDTNHRISKTLVAKAANARKALALEGLTGINEQMTFRRAQRSFRMSWAFHQLRLFIAYKAAAAGVSVVLVDPAYTSRTCSVCRHCAKANRQSQASFLCRSCGFACNADWNAARNIAYLAGVTPPIVSDATHRPRRLSYVRVVAPGTSPRALAVGT